ncbi:connector enhancer of kinase suppressor of ras 1 [Bufo bufo]|uniref:connector enhancer of kinase suppressor of ras 1 n=1 Tax=Bufo bufo TaxID=8384 RepID=UPI001ABEADF6|nr:connector enhancer of kinase suppressor of ras 1 [Bufo bufo]
MELISSWSPDTVRGYLEGLDPAVQQYPCQGWRITGQDLLDLSPQHLDALGVRSIGHQEIFLEAVEQLCALHYELHSETLRSLTDKLYRVSRILCSHILTLRKASSPSLALSPTQKQLACIIDIISAARGLFSWLNRYLFTRLNDYSATRDVIALCVELAEVLHKDWSDPLIENRILAICENVCGVCRSILNCSPESLLSQTATLELVQIYPEASSLGIEFKSTASGQHFVCRLTPESPAQRCGQIFPGDEIIKVNDQVVVGWTQKNLVWKLQERSNCVDIVLKKVTIYQSKSPVSPNQKKVHGMFRSSSSSRSALESPLMTDIPSSPTEWHGASIITHTSPLTAISTSTILTSNPLSLGPEASSREHLETNSPSSKNFLEANQHQSKEYLSHIHNTWPSSGTPHYKPPASIIFHSASVHPSSESLSLENTMSSTIYAKTLTPLSQISLELDPQDLKDIPRPRSGSESSPKSTISLLSVPLSPGILRTTVSESNLLNPANAAVPQKFQGQEGSLKNSDTTSISSQSRQKDKKLHLSPVSGQPNRDKRALGGVSQTQKGAATKLSRRRVSCKDLGSPDCDGWLWQRKENVSFMSQKWKRCWCVLKKDRLYWYNSPQDEKAIGLLNISSYSLESTREAKSKKKYEFQLSHPTYKPFVFAADNLTDMQMWVTFLLKSLQRYTAPQNSSHSREEDCYSETEAEDDDQVKSHDMVKKPLIPSPSNYLPGSTSAPGREEGAEGGHVTKSNTVQQLKQSPVKNTSEAISAATCEEGAEGGQLPKSSKGIGDDLEIMMTCLKQGGVSLIGKKTTMTRDEYRKSFIRRNKNPDINHKAHALRVLQSTLKAKLLELQSLNQVLENPDLTSAAFQKWKSQHEHHYGSLEKSPQTQRAVAGNLYQERKDDDNHGVRESEESD